MKIIDKKSQEKVEWPRTMQWKVFCTRKGLRMGGNFKDMKAGKINKECF